MCFQHRDLTVQASNIDYFGSPYRVPTARADVLSTAGFLWENGGSAAAMSASAGDRNAVVFIAENQNVRQASL